MALFPKTPGVYVEEVSTLPPSVAPVSTAIPAFVGFTEFGTLNTPTRVTSLLEYEANFGGPKHEAFSVNVTLPLTPSSVTVTLSTFSLYYHMKMFFGNGGGPCYIVSIGDYSTAISPTNEVPFQTGLAKCEQIDEITLLVIPEAINLSDAKRKIINDEMLAQCAKLGDRFSILDVETTTSITTDASNFRSNHVGPNNLKYGASYYPNLKTALNRFYVDSEVAITASGTYVSPNNKLSSILSGVATNTTMQVDSLPVATNTFVLAGTTFTARSGALLSNADFKIGLTVGATAINIAKVINNHPSVGAIVYATVASDTLTIIARTGGAALFTLTTAFPLVFDISAINAGTDNSQNTGLYNDVKNLLAAYLLTLYPGPTMAGIYSSVDNTLGVWKAPANVGVNLISGPSVVITNESQENLNVDVSGKSINAIRNFSGRGPIVWGARTLDGNSNEWRYVNVRRLFIMAEESCKKASEFVVFEPNDKNTWNRVKGTIGSFLTSLWSDGALTGDKAEQAFFVKVGLNETMTVQDILEGRMIVEIGLAAVRPAEFIILRFSHKLQES